MYVFELKLFYHQLHLPTTVPDTQTERMIRASFAYINWSFLVFAQEDPRFQSQNEETLWCHLPDGFRF